MAKGRMETGLERAGGKLDRGTVVACLEAVKGAAVTNGAEEAGRSSAEAAVRALLEG